MRKTVPVLLAMLLAACASPAPRDWSASRAPAPAAGVATLDPQADPVGAFVEAWLAADETPAQQRHVARGAQR